jgi:hypothetical protein
MSCDECRQSPAEDVLFRHNIGMLFMLQIHTTEATLCRACAKRAFVEEA